MVLDLAEPDDVYQTALLDNLFRSFPVTSYTLTASRRLIDRRRMRLYGIQATQIFPDGSVLRRTFPELSDNRRIVENLVKRLNNGLVSFDHFEEILEDFIAGDYRAVFPYTAGLSRKSRLIPGRTPFWRKTVKSSAGSIPCY